MIFALAGVAVTAATGCAAFGELAGAGAVMGALLWFLFDPRVGSRALHVVLDGTPGLRKALTSARLASNPANPPESMSVEDRLAALEAQSHQALRLLHAQVQSYEAQADLQRSIVFWFALPGVTGTAAWATSSYIATSLA